MDGDTLLEDGCSIDPVDSFDVTWGTISSTIDESSESEEELETPGGK